MKTTITIKGTHCHACQALIEDICKEIPGIKFCAVNFATGVTELEHDEQMDWQKFKKAIESLGSYKVE